MLQKIRRLFGFLDWLGLIAFCTVFGIKLLERNTAVGIAVLCGAAFLVYLMFDMSNVKYSRGNHFGFSRPLGDPLIDICLLITCYTEFDLFNIWHPLYSVGIVMLTIDLAYYAFIYLDERVTLRKKRRMPSEPLP